ncbi:Uncharacterized protein dnm_028460 [Desulfonema magnum]|uniref:Uncharacterized protein n=1 Tax=Desulfonema magnum TaxID=45655 RepID=A0A975BK90_9BACT|nr:Uncharacterized protein dnm_028460 [Desulfonema magnum]
MFSLSPQIPIKNQGAAESFPGNTPGAETSRRRSDRVLTWGDENVYKALKKLIPFLFPAFFNFLIFNS